MRVPSDNRCATMRVATGPSHEVRQEHDVAGKRQGRCRGDWARHREINKDILPSKPARRRIEESLGHNQINTRASFGRDSAVQIDVFADELGGHFRRRADWCQPKRASSANMLLDMSDGKVLVMQSWTNFVNKGETADNLKDLGSQFKELPSIEHRGSLT